MGGNSSKNISNIVNETTASVIMQSMQSCMSQSSQSQTISGSYVNGVQQKATSVMNVACASHFNMTSDLAFSIASAIQQQAEAKGVALLDTLHLNRSENISNIANRIQAKISSQLVQTAIANTAQNQVITGSIAINSSQTLDSNTTLKALTDMTANTGLALDIENQTSQKSSATQSNPLDFITSSIYLLMAIIFFVLLMFGGIIYVILS